MSNTYVQEWQAFHTKLLLQMEAPQLGDELEGREGTVEVVSYESNGLKLKALLETKNIDSMHRKPVIVYCHGGFASGYSEVSQDCKPFTDAGYIVLVPTYRGENDNPGNFELFMGEIADAKAAIRWIATQPWVDTTRIFTYGHSIGGGVSLLLSMHGDVPIRYGGSCAGLYNVSNIIYRSKYQGRILFDTTNKEELIWRTPVLTLEFMVRDHVMYVGKDDYAKEDRELLSAIYPNKSLKLDLVEIEGDHWSSLQPSMKLFLQKIEAMK